MRKLKVGLLAILVIAVTLYALAFAVSNNQPLALDFLAAQPINLPAAVWLAGALGVGLVLGVVAGSIAGLKHKRRAKQLQKQLKQHAPLSGSF